MEILWKAKQKNVLYKKNVFKLALKIRKVIGFKFYKKIKLQKSYSSQRNPCYIFMLCPKQISKFKTNLVKTYLDCK